MPSDQREAIAQAIYEAFAKASASKIGQLPPWDSIGPAKQDWYATADAVLPLVEAADQRGYERGCIETGFEMAKKDAEVGEIYKAAGRRESLAEARKATEALVDEMLTEGDPGPTGTYSPWINGHEFKRRLAALNGLQS